MTSCEICKIIQNGFGQIYDDDEIYAYLHPRPMVEGHIVVTTKKHFTILEQIPDHVVQKLFSVANKMSIIAFELLKVQGTNIIVNNGISAGQTQPHFSINIVPRKENDGINFTWTPKKLSPAELNAIESKYIKSDEEMSSIGNNSLEVIEDRKKEDNRIVGNKADEVRTSAISGAVSGSVVQESAKKTYNKGPEKDSEKNLDDSQKKNIVNESQNKNRDNTKRSETEEKKDNDEKDEKNVNKDGDSDDEDNVEVKEDEVNYMIKQLERMP